MLKKKYKTALITGAASGIGYNILKKLRHEKIKVLAVDKDKKKLEKVCNKMQSTPIHLDLNNTKEIYKLLSKIKVDILVSNAGIGKGINGLLKSSQEEIEISTKINIESHLHLLRCVIPNMVKKRKGHIIIMGSLAGLYPIDSALYGSQKGAIHRLAQSLRIELQGTRVKVTEICPGRTRTDFGKNAFKDLKMAKKFMSGFSILDPEDISDAVLFALNTKWRSNISLIEVSGTEQTPGGIPVHSVKDPILD